MHVSRVSRMRRKGMKNLCRFLNLYGYIDSYYLGGTTSVGFWSCSPEGLTTKELLLNRRGSVAEVRFA